MIRLLQPSVIVVLLLGALALAGCGGGGGGGGGVPVVVDTGTITGLVVRADDTAQGVANAQVSVQVGSQTFSTTANGVGRYTLANVPVGTQTIVASAPNNPGLRSQQVTNIAVAKNETTVLNISLLAQNQTVPTDIALDPTDGSVDLNGEINFAVAMSAGGTAVAGKPTFYLTGGIGTISPNGKFTATAVGQGRLWAICGAAQTSANITVTPSRPPQITTFLVSPLEFGASGGTLNLTVAANDGDGIADGSVVAEIYPPINDTVFLTVPRVDGTSEQDGTYRVSWTVPANSNTPNAAGVQAEMNYSVRVVVTDRSGAVSRSDFVEFVVKGLATPPAPPAH